MHIWYLYSSYYKCWKKSWLSELKDMNFDLVTAFIMILNYKLFKYLAFLYIEHAEKNFIKIKITFGE